MISGRKSRKGRRQWWIPAVAGSTLLSGLLFGSAMDTVLIESKVQQTVSFDEGWNAFDDHLSRVSSLSAWLALFFLVFAAFALPRALRVGRRYFAEVKLLQAKPAIVTLLGILLLAIVAGFYCGSLMDRILTALGVVPAGR